MCTGLYDNIKSLDISSAFDQSNQLIRQINFTMNGEANDIDYNSETATKCLTNFNPDHKHC